jgi:hypothetical protein
MEFHARMEQFISKHADKIQGTLSCFDRILFRGYLPFFSGAAFAAFLDGRGIRRPELKSFLLRQAARLKDHARHLAAREGRPFEYFGGRVRKEDLARQIAERDHIERGLVCVFSTLEPCRTYSLRWDHASYIQSARRKCLFLYYYFMDPEYGLIHVRIQTWFPLQIQVYLNGHEWLARKLARHGVRFTKQDNAFLWIEDFRRAQNFADRFVSLDWVARLHRYARWVNPLLKDLLAPMCYYWVTAQAEYSTDIVFKSQRQLEELVPRLLEHSTLQFGARDIMTFLGRKLHGKFEGEVVTDQGDRFIGGRLPGRRVKHRMKQNWLKMYDKAGRMVRVETVINAPEEFRVRRRVRRRGRRAVLWVPLRKSVVYLFRYREVSLQSNSRYLNALAQVDDPTAGLRALDAITSRKQPPSARPVKAFNPLARPDSQLFAALMNGEHVVRGFTNRDLRDKLAASAFSIHDDPKKASSQVSRLLHRLHVHGLVAKIPRSRRWRVTAFGYSVMATVVKLRQRDFPSLYAAAA